MSGSSNKSKRCENVVEQCARAYTDDPRPRRLGKMFAFWYNGKNEPRILIGPDWLFSLVEMCLANGIIGMILNSALASS